MKYYPIFLFFVLLSGSFLFSFVLHTYLLHPYQSVSFRRKANANSVHFLNKFHQFWRSEAKVLKQLVYVMDSDQNTASRKTFTFCSHKFRLKQTRIWLFSIYVCTLSTVKGKHTTNGFRSQIIKRQKAKVSWLNRLFCDRKSWLFEDAFCYFRMISCKSENQIIFSSKLTSVLIHLYLYIYLLALRGFISIIVISLVLFILPRDQPRTQAVLQYISVTFVYLRLISWSENEG